MRLDWVVFSEATGPAAYPFDSGALQTEVYSLFGSLRATDPTSGAPNVSRLPMETSGLLLRGFKPIANARCLVLAHTNDTALLAQAPAVVQSLAAELAADPEYRANSAFVSYVNTCIWIVARQVEALRLGLYRLHYLMGARYVFPHADWYEPINPHVDLPFEARIIKPRMASLSWEGNGGFGTDPGLPGQAAAAQAHKDYFAQNQCPRMAYLQATSDGDLNYSADRRYELGHDHTLLAWVPGSQIGAGSPGERGYSSTTGSWNTNFTGENLSKMCLTHHGTSGASPPAAPIDPNFWQSVTLTPSDSSLTADPGPDSSANTSDYVSWGGGFALHAIHHLQSYCGKLRTYGIDGPYTHINLEPADGSNLCRCVTCLGQLRDGPDGAGLPPAVRALDAWESENLAHWANVHAVFYKEYFKNTALRFPASVGWSAYTVHVDPPRFDMEPNQYVQIVTNSYSTNQCLTIKELLRQWGAKRNNNPKGKFQLGAFPTWSIVAGTWDAPSCTWQMVRDEAKLLEEIGCDKILVQTTEGPFANWFAFYAVSRWMWGADLDEAYAEGFQVAFGPAASAVRAMYDRWHSTQIEGTGWGIDQRGNYFWNPQDLAFMYQDIQTVEAALGPSPAAKYRRRVDDFKLYLHYQRLYCEYVIAKDAYAVAANATTEADLISAVNTVASFIWDQIARPIVHTTRISSGIMFEMPKTSSALNACIASWKDSSPLGSALAAKVASPAPALTSSQCEDLMVADRAAYPGIAGLQRRSFSDNLVPLLRGTSTAIVNYVGQADSEQLWRFNSDGTSFTLQVRVQNLSSSGAPAMKSRFQILSLAGAVLEEHEITIAADQAVYTWSFTISLPAGTYGLILIPQPTKSLQLLGWPRNVPCVMMGDFKIREFYTATKNYFYVPPGETKIGLIFDRNTNGAIRFFDPSGNVVTTTYSAPNLWTCDVPAGQSGKVWSFDGWLRKIATSYPRFINCPTVFSPHPDQMMVPSELLN